MMQHNYSTEGKLLEKVVAIANSMSLCTILGHAASMLASRDVVHEWTSLYTLAMDLPVFSSISCLEKELPYRLYGAAYGYEQSVEHRPFGFPLFQLLYCESGLGRIDLDGIHSSIHPGQAVLLYPDEAHAYGPGSDVCWSISWISFGGYQLNALLGKLGLGKSGVFDVSDSSKLMNLFKQATVLLSQQTIASRLESSVLVYACILECYHRFENGILGIPEGRKNLMAPAIAVMHNEYYRHIALDELACACRMGVQQFCKIFKECYQARPMEYLQSLRVKQSIRLLLEDPGVSIASIISQTGFGSESYFAAVFKRHQGMSPSEYRKLHASGE